jgi:hypothetical protein
MLSIWGAPMCSPTIQNKSGIIKIIFYTVVTKQTIHGK